MPSSGHFLLQTNEIILQQSRSTIALFYLNLTQMAAGTSHRAPASVEFNCFCFAWNIVGLISRLSRCPPHSDSNSPPTRYTHPTIKINLINLTSRTIFLACSNFTCLEHVLLLLRLPIKLRAEQLRFIVKQFRPA